MADEQQIDPEIGTRRGRESQWELVRDDVRRVLWSGLAAATAGLVAAVAFGVLLGGTAWAGAMVWGLASLAGGFGMGFLFGIPRSGRRESADARDDANGAGDSLENCGDGGVQMQRPNTNLEQISDWVTKILVGLGLVELRNMPDRVWALAKLAADTMCGPHCSGQAASFALAVMVYFAVAGFIFGYLLTRTYLPGAFDRAESTLKRRVEAAVRKVAEVERKAEEVERRSVAAAHVAEQVALGRVSRATGAAIETAPPPMAMGAPEAAVAGQGGEPVEFDPEDPNKGRFGGLSKRDGYELSARVSESEELSEFYDVELEVRSSNGSREMPRSVTFHLHPTFGQPVQEVPVREGVARLNVLAWGAFTVGAVVGQTRLELDLSELPDAPKAFREQ